MIVCIVCDVLGAKNNGTTMAATNLIDYLTGQGHEVRVVCCDKDKKGKENYYVTPTLNLGKFCNKILEENGVSLAKTDDKILTEAIKGSDVVHILIPFGLARKAIKIATANNLPITASFHCQAENITAHVFLMNVGFVNKLIYKNFYKHIGIAITSIIRPNLLKTFSNSRPKRQTAWLFRTELTKTFSKAAKPKEFRTSSR